MGGISAEAAGAFVATLALGVSAWSVFYLARQTKAAAEQTRAAAEQTRAAAEQTMISNAVAAVSANDMVLRSLREVHVLMLERPGSRAYFYGDRPLPEESSRRDEILTIAELLADVLSSGIHVHSCVPGSASAEPWADYCRHVLGSSRVLRDLVRAHPGWWSNLTALLPSSSSS
ncbi:hypothetical protein KEF29_27545 [Streptomyces tuirus]|uniref:Uncharacterized protein n=1 Tax=Streptomyces tuirus TaxID=68278 RepID=A0A941FFJ1_9ACTN|nr:hypothetical protein [Streptomyces tuirus]